MVVVLLIITVLVASGGRLVNGAEIDGFPIPDADFLFITLEGEIRKGDAERLVIALKKIEGKLLDDEMVTLYLRLNSPGGDVIEAMKMVKILRRIRLGHAMVNGECNSACFYLLATAKNKYWDDDDTVGIHRPYLLPEYLVGLSPKEAEALHKKVTAQITQMLTDLNVPMDLIEDMMATASKYLLPIEPSRQPLPSPYPGFDEWVDAQCGKVPFEMREVWIECVTGRETSADVCDKVERVMDEKLICEIKLRNKEQLRVIREIIKEHHGAR
ncbi:hypothetical protein N9980_01125 [bacterium]|nr:hypothetical protein [bacterium]